MVCSCNASRVSVQKNSVPPIKKYWYCFFGTSEYTNEKKNHIKTNHNQAMVRVEPLSLITLKGTKRESIILKSDFLFYLQRAPVPRGWQCREQAAHMQRVVNADLLNAV